MELTKEQINRQDFVDNEIYQLLEKLNPTNIPLNWDIENISNVREIIKDIFVEELNLCDEQTFYPFVNEQ